MQFIVINYQRIRKVEMKQDFKISLLFIDWTQEFIFRVIFSEIELI